MLQVHKDSLDKVPNAIPGREDPELVIHGIEGVPEHVLMAKAKGTTLEEQLLRERALEISAAYASQPSASSDHVYHPQAPQQYMFQPPPPGMPYPPLPPMYMPGITMMPGYMPGFPFPFPGFPTMSGPPPRSSPDTEAGEVNQVIKTSEDASIPSITAEK